MRTYTWEEYYDKFFDWAESTQVRNLSALTSLGSADEVGEIIFELQYNVPASNRLLKKAIAAKLAFSADYLVEFTCINDEALVIAAVRNSAEQFSAEDMEYLYVYGDIDEEILIEICEQQNILLPRDLREEEYEDDEEEDIEENPIDDMEIHTDDFGSEADTQKLGFFGILAAIFVGILTAIFKGLLAGDFSNEDRKHNGRCNGDCAHCPPHYGYRYGRWYYGHDHAHGCEFGGNKGSGSMD